MVEEPGGSAGLFAVREGLFPGLASASGLMEVAAVRADGAWLWRRPAEAQAIAGSVSPSICSKFLA
jgi:hypothetical protein